MLTIEIIAAVLFATALLHTFSTTLFERLAHRHPRHAGLLHLLGEVEVVFGFWAMVLVVTMALLDGVFFIHLPRNSPVHEPKYACKAAHLAV